MNLPQRTIASILLPLSAAIISCVGMNTPRTRQGLDAPAAHSLGAEPVFLLDHNGVRINAFVTGKPSADRRVVFIHGWAGSGAEFLELAERLCADRADIACFCVDLPGSGSSGKPADVPYDIPYFRAAIRAIIASAASYGRPGGQPARDLTLVGHSLGGHLCIDYAVHDGSGIDRLALVAPAGWPGEVGAMQAWASKNDLTLWLVPRFITEETYVAGHKLMMFLSASGYPEAVPRYTGRALATPEGRFALEAITRNSLENDHIDEVLSDVTVPVLLTWGRNDPVLPFSYAEKFLSRLPPGVRFLPFERCGHMPHCERVPELALAISDFIGP